MGGRGCVYPHTYICTYEHREEIRTCIFGQCSHLSVCSLSSITTWAQMEQPQCLSVCSLSSITAWAQMEQPQLGFSIVRPNECELAPVHMAVPGPSDPPVWSASPNPPPQTGQTNMSCNSHLNDFINEGHAKTFWACLHCPTGLGPSPSFSLPSSRKQKGL